MKSTGVLSLTSKAVSQDIINLKSAHLYLQLFCFALCLSLAICLAITVQHHSHMQCHVHLNKNAKKQKGKSDTVSIPWKRVVWETRAMWEELTKNFLPSSEEDLYAGGHTGRLLLDVRRRKMALHPWHCLYFMISLMKSPRCWTMSQRVKMFIFWSGGRWKMAVWNT